MSDTLQQSLGTTVNATPTAGRTVTFYDALLGPTFASAGSVDISSTRKRGTAKLDLGKKLPFDLTFTYMRELKSGYRGEEGGGVYSAVSSVVEVPGPLNEITQDFGVRAAYNFEKGNIHGAFVAQPLQQPRRDADGRQPLPVVRHAVRRDSRPGRGRRHQRPLDQRARQRGQHGQPRLPAQVRPADPHRRRPHAGELDAERAVLPVHHQHGDPDADRGPGRQPVGAPAAVVRRQDRHDDDQPHVLVEAGGEPRPPRAVPQLRPEQQDGPFRHHRRRGRIAGPQLDRRHAHRGATRTATPRPTPTTTRRRGSPRPPATTSARSPWRGRSGSPASSGPAARRRRATTTASRSPRCTAPRTGWTCAPPTTRPSGRPRARRSTASSPTRPSARRSAPASRST